MECASDAQSAEVLAGDIDPNSAVLIRLYIKNTSAPHDGTSLFTSVMERTAMIDRVSQSIGSLAEHTGREPAADTTSSDMTREQIMCMPMLRLEHMRRRVQQLEVFNYGLLKKVYGDQIDAETLLSFNERTWALNLDFGSGQYREALYKQYRKMMILARKPDINGQSPSSEEGALLLQRYLNEVIMLAKHHQDHLRIEGFSEHSLLRRTNTLTQVRRQPFKVDKTRHQPQIQGAGSFHVGIRSPFRGNAALSDYQKQLALLEQENQRRIAGRENSPVPRNSSSGHASTHELSISVPSWGTKTGRTP